MSVPPPRSLPAPVVRLAGWVAALATVAGLCALATRPVAGAEPAGPESGAPLSAPAILEELRHLRETGSVLFIAAHPDDENTRLIAYLANGRGYRTAYLSLTRGDGGQDLLGPEIGEELGVIRTQELLAARRIDGGRQFFSRARDFGFSKDYRSTLERWGRAEVLGDVVRVIRTFRPDVIITRFSPEPSATHGHHTASAVLALEAFRLAGDPRAYPEQLDTLAPWQARRVVWDVMALAPAGAAGRRGAGNPAAAAGGLSLDLGGYDPVLGESYGEIAARSRSMHKSQGMGALGTRGSALEHFEVLAGAPASQDILDGVDSTWGRFPGGAAIGPAIDHLLAHFNPLAPSGSVPALLSLRTRLAALPRDAVVADRRRQLDRIVQACLGLYFETTSARAEVVPGEAMHLRHLALLRSEVPVRWLGVRYPGDAAVTGEARELPFNRAQVRDTVRTLPADTPVSQPYWLREEGTAGRFRVDDPTLIGRPDNPPSYPLEEVFEVGGQTLALPDEPVDVSVDPLRGEVRRRMEVIPPVSLNFVDALELFAPGSTRQATIEVTAARADTGGRLRLSAPSGWRVAPAAQAFHFGAPGERVRLTFAVTAPDRPAVGDLAADAEIGGAHYDTRRIELRYAHLPPILLQPRAVLHAVSLQLAIRGHAVGYLPGAGDLVGESLERMGYAVTRLTGADLTPERLRTFDAVVLGIRAFNTRTDLAAHLPALFAYAEAGGTVIAQYNTPNELITPRLAPYELKLSRDLPGHRITDPAAPLTWLVPDHPAFTTPNRLGPADFDGWVQERGLNFPDRWDPRFTPLLAGADAGESPLRGALLVARCGRGYFVYTGLSWFRQLPEGVPGAYRLFANLVSLGR
jgi:LmbE family N-acetylglucosaminyl deacetylase